MGYGIILRSNDTALRNQLDSDPLQAVRDLETILGVDSYPGKSLTGTTAGAWDMTASVHSRDITQFVLTAGGLTPGSGEPSLDSPVAGWHAAATRYALFGTDASVETASSAWWVYADSLPWALDDSEAALLAEHLRAIVTLQTRTAAPVGVYGNAVNIAGGVTARAEVELWWSGNRMCTADELLPAELARLTPAR